MPEGHTIHRLALDLGRAFSGSTLSVSSPQGRFISAAVIDGKRLERAHAIGKHLFLDFENGRVHIHLGLFGKFKRQAALDQEPRPSVRLRLLSESACWDLTGPTACDLVDDDQFVALQERLGADPLSKSARPARTWQKVKTSKRSLGALLLDQSVFAGIGNVYRAELLFLIGVHPETRGHALEKKSFEKLWKLARELLARGVKANRIVTVTGADRKTKKREALYVYKQRFCRVCRVPIVRSVNATRMMFHCPHCQPSAQKERTAASVALPKIGK
jgi:endonuclease VIII